jgi:type III pantothenate kinase
MVAIPPVMRHCNSELVILEMNGFIADHRKEHEDLKVLLTGGDAKLFEKELKNGIFADPNLVLKGLNEILLYNSET